MRRISLALLMLMALLGASISTPAAAATTVRAVASWSMVPLAKDANGDGFIDGDGGRPRAGALGASPSSAFTGAGNRVAQPNERLVDGALSWYLPDGGYPVRLDACASRGTSYRWTITGPSGSTSRTKWMRLARKGCATTVTLPEGDVTLSLEVRSGSRSATDTVPATIRNILVLALGDSYASGEGNPRNVKAWLAGSAAFTPYWDDDACNRSVRGAPAQAALDLERLSPRTSVTLVYLACSGATVDRGLLGPQNGQQPSQIEQARTLIGDREVDLVTISVGGNDVGFGSILQTCALNADCPLSRASAPPLSGYPTVQEGTQAETGALAAKYARIAACLGGPVCTLVGGRTIPAIRLAPTARVLPTLYPDITRAADGQPCSYFTIRPNDFAWARATILSPTTGPAYGYQPSRGGVVQLPMSQGTLNQQVAATAALPGWLPVTGTWSASGDSAVGHGVCAGQQAWVFPVTSFSGFSSASFHPNVDGQAVMAAAILAAMQASLP